MCSSTVTMGVSTVGSNVLMILHDTVRATVREVTQKQLLAASTIPGPNAPVVQAVPEHLERAEKARVFGARKN